MADPINKCHASPTRECVAVDGVCARCGSRTTPTPVPAASERQIDWPFGPCCMEGQHECACGTEERYLRAVKNNPSYRLTPEQREWCLSEIGRVEGYDRAEHTSDTDAQLAGNVLNAWTDFCRDKGLL